LLGKVTTNTPRLKELGDTVVGLSMVISSIKADQGCLHIVIDKIQIKQLKVSDKLSLEPQQPQAIDLPPKPYAVGSKVDVLLNAVTQKVSFPKYVGSNNLLPWLHRYEQFFWAVRTPEIEKVSLH
jgi:hypothetical protein